MHTYPNIVYGVQKNIIQHVSYITNRIKYHKFQTDTMNTAKQMLN